MLFALRKENAFAYLLRGISSILVLAAIVSAQGNIEGHWEGVFTVNQREIEISLDLSKNETSQWIGSMGLPSERVTGLLVKDIAVSATSVDFVAVEFQNAKVSLMLVRDGGLKGTISSPQGPRTVAFRRTGAAQVRLISVNPAVSKDLEGDWEGVINTGPDAFNIVIHFKNLPDGTVSAAVDVPDSDDFGSPLSSVRQRGRTVEFRIPAAQADFKGSLNQGGTEITGQLERTQGTAPLKLLRKRSSIKTGNSGR